MSLRSEDEGTGGKAMVGGRISGELLKRLDRIDCELARAEDAVDPACENRAATDMGGEGKVEKVVDKST